MNIVTGCTNDYTLTLKGVKVWEFADTRSSYLQKVELIMDQLKDDSLMWLDADCEILKDVPKMHESKITVCQLRDSFFLHLYPHHRPIVETWLADPKTRYSDGSVFCRLMYTSGDVVDINYGIKDPLFEPREDPWLIHHRRSYTNTTRGNHVPSNSASRTCCGN